MKSELVIIFTRMSQPSKKTGIKAMLNWLIVSVVIIGVFYTGSLILALNRYFEVSKIIK